MTKTVIICKDCGNEFLSTKDIKAVKSHDKPHCKCGSRNCEQK